MSLTDRDRKIMLLLIPAALILAYWFLVLAPKREQSAAAQNELTQAQSERDSAVQKLAGLTAAKRSFGTDYATVISLGKSIPVGVEMPSLLVQLDQAAKGTGIRFTSIQTGDRSGTSATTSGSGSSRSGSSGGANGGNGPASSSTPAQSGPGKAAQSAGNAVSTSNSSSTAAGASTPAASGGSGGATSSSSSTALDSVPLDFQFKGSFFDLTDFFHRMKRFVRVANNRIVVSGRLMTINSFTFDAKQSFPQIKATVHATVYLAPKAQGVAAGASPSGPAGSSAAGTAGGQSASSSTPTPAATVTAP